MMLSGDRAVTMLRPTHPKERLCDAEHQRNEFQEPCNFRTLDVREMVMSQRPIQNGEQIPTHPSSQFQTEAPVLTMYLEVYLQLNVLTPRGNINSKELLKHSLSVSQQLMRRGTERRVCWASELDHGPFYETSYSMCNLLTHSPPVNQKVSGSNVPGNECI